MIIDSGKVARASLTKDQRQTLQLAVVDWPPIARVNKNFAGYVGDALSLPCEGHESLSTVCLKSGLEAYRKNLATPDQARLIAFLQAFLLTAANWLSGMYIESDDGAKWMVGHDEPLGDWLKPRNGAHIVETAFPSDAVFNQLFKLVTPPRLFNRLESM